jgi:hypothetical protein
VKIPKKATIRLGPARRMYVEKLLARGLHGNSVEEVVPMAEVGDRVFAVRNADEKTVYMFGRGIYQGRQAGGPLQFPNPKIELDGGAVVWGCECWWGREDRADEYIAGRAVEIVPTPAEKP